jgi:hypothetical protein
MTSTGMYSWTLLPVRALLPVLHRGFDFDGTQPGHYDASTTIHTMTTTDHEPRPKANNVSANLLFSPPPELLDVCDS